MNTHAAGGPCAHHAAVIELLRLRGPLPRAELARQLDLSAATLTRVVDGLLADGLVERAGRSAERECGPGRVGRPGELLALRGAARAVVAVDLGGTKMFGALVDLAGTIEGEQYVRHGAKGEQAVEALCDLIAGLLAVPRPAGQLICGIGVGAPGVTCAAEGIITFAPALDWRDVPLAAILRERFDLPAFVENDVNLAALGEAGYGAARGCPNAVCLAIGTGIGAGLVIDGRLYHGHTHSAGEVGYMIPGVEHLALRPAGFGIYESLASGSAIAERGQRLAAEQGVGAGVATSLPFPSPGDTGQECEQSSPAPAPTMTAEDVFAAARAGEGWAMQAISETVDLLSIGIANIAGLLDPEVIVIGGGVARSADLLIEPIRARLDGALPALPRLVASPLGYRAGVLGAVKLVVDSLLVA
jgi:predicted NBD/HSP70 family sugar kinase